MVQEQQRLLCRLPNSLGGRDGPPGRMPPLKRQQDYNALIWMKAAEAAQGRGVPKGEEVAAAAGKAGSKNQEPRTKKQDTKRRRDRETRRNGE